jgi:hypothetical protein
MSTDIDLALLSVINRLFALEDRVVHLEQLLAEAGYTRPTPIEIIPPKIITGGQPHGAP